MQQEKTTGAIILAAGNSSRLGRPKQLLTWEGESLIRRAARIALDAGCMPVRVVYGACKTEIETALEGMPIEFMLNPDWEQGMGTSLQVGIQNISTLPCDGMLLMVCDQPFLSVDHLQKLMEVFYSQDVDSVASAYAKTTGVPIIISTHLLKTNFITIPHQGAKQIVRQIPPKKQATVYFPKGEIDIDTEEDWENLLIC